MIVLRVLRTKKRLRALFLLPLLVSTCAIASAGVSARAPTLPGHPMLVDRDGLRVYGPARHAGAPCPHLLPLPANARADVKRAIELAMPPFERELKLNGRDAIVKVGAASRSGFSPSAGGCGRTAWKRSIVAFVRLPHVTFSASLSQHTFAVGRVTQGWVLWASIH